MTPADVERDLRKILEGIIVAHFGPVRDPRELSDQVRGILQKARDGILIGDAKMSAQIAKAIMFDDGEAYWRFWEILKTRVDGECYAENVYPLRLVMEALEEAEGRAPAPPD